MKAWRALWLSVMLVLLAQPALADKYWVGPNLNTLWTNANNWSNTSGGPGGAGQPGASENAFLTQNDATNRAVFYNSLSNPLLNTVTVDAIGTGTITLRQSSKAYPPLMRLSALTAPAASPRPAAPIR